MSAFTKPRGAVVGVLAGIAVAGLALAGCTSTPGGTASTSAGDPNATITLGTTDTIISLDPAGEYDNGSFAVDTQVFGFLFDTPYNSPDVQPDLADSASWTDPNTLEVKLKSGLKFANGDDLTASDVKFSLDRVKAIGASGADSGNGPSSLLANVDKVTAVDDLTVDIHDTVANDQTLEQVLSSPAGPIVDEQVFSPTALTPAADIVKANAFSGQYVITSYTENQLVQYKPNAAYGGILPKPANGEVDVKYYTDASNLQLDVSSGNIDAAYRSLAPTDLATDKANANLSVTDGPGGEIRYLVFNFKTQPFGTGQPDADAAKALAVRQAIADLVDRTKLASLYSDTYTPLYSYVPDGLTGATTSLKSLYGDGNGAPSLDKATSTLAAAGITSPVALDITYNTDHYGPLSADEYGEIKSELEASGLFTVNLSGVANTDYAAAAQDGFPIFQRGWFPDYSDADNYLYPFFPNGGFFNNHYDNPDVDALIAKEQAETDASARATEIGQIQDLVAKDLSTIPLLQGSQVIVTSKSVSGAVLDASFKFRYATLTK